MRSAAIDGVDLEVSLLATRPRFLDGLREQFPRALAYNLLDAWAGAWPEDDPRAFRGVGADTLAELRPYEGSAIAMLDRANWTGASAMAMRSIYLRHVEIWDTLIRERRPDLVVIHGDPHRCWDYLLHALCRERGITTAIVERTLLADRLVLKPSIEHMGGPPPARVREVAGLGTAPRRGRPDPPADERVVLRPGDHPAGAGHGRTRSPAAVPQLAAGRPGAHGQRVPALRAALPAGRSRHADHAVEAQAVQRADPPSDHAHEGGLPGRGARARRSPRPRSTSRSTTSPRPPRCLRAASCTTR